MLVLGCGGEFPQEVSPLFARSFVPFQALPPHSEVIQRYFFPKLLFGPFSKGWKVHICFLHFPFQHIQQSKSCHIVHNMEAPEVGRYKCMQLLRLVLGQHHFCSFPSYFIKDMFSCVDIEIGAYVGVIFSYASSSTPHPCQ